MAVLMLQFSVVEECGRSVKQHVKSLEKYFVTATLTMTSVMVVKMCSSE